MPQTRILRAEGPRILILAVSGDGSIKGGSGRVSLSGAAFFLEFGTHTLLQSNRHIDARPVLFASENSMCVCRTPAIHSRQFWPEGFQRAIGKPFGRARKREISSLGKALVLSENSMRVCRTPAIRSRQCWPEAPISERWAAEVFLTFRRREWYNPGAYNISRFYA